MKPDYVKKYYKPEKRIMTVTQLKLWGNPFDDLPGIDESIVSKLPDNVKKHQKYVILRGTEKTTDEFQQG
jgi:hypothetical protein